MKQRTKTEKGITVVLRRGVLTGLLLMTAVPKVCFAEEASVRELRVQEGPAQEAAEQAVREQQAAVQEAAAQAISAEAISAEKASAEAVSATVPSAEEGPAQEAAVQEPAAETCERVEWDQIEERIERSNPTYRLYYDSAMETADSMLEAYSDFSYDMQDQMDVLDASAKELEENRKTIQALPSEVLPDGRGGYTTKTAMLAQLVQAEKQIVAAGQTIKSARVRTRLSVQNAPDSVRRAMGGVKARLTYTVEGLVITYEQLLISRDLLEGQVQLYKEMESMYDTMASEGLATKAESEGAKASRLSAESMLRSLDSSISTLKAAIGLQLGFAPGTSFTIGSLPDPDMNFQEGRNPEADKEKAVMSNSTLRAAESPDGGNQTDLDRRDFETGYLTGLICLRTESLYNDITRKKELLTSAQTTLEIAERSEASAAVKLKQGLISRVEYAGLRLQNLSEKAAARNAKLELFRSIHTYRWALRGILPEE